jgi:putative ABC transport system permease protein
MINRFTIVAEYFRMAWMALWAHKLRSSLTTLGILIGVTTIIGIFTAIKGINEYVIGEISVLGSNTVYVQKFQWGAGREWWRYRNRKEITYKEYKALRENAVYADYICPQVFSNRTIKYKNEAYERVDIVGTNEEYKDTQNVLPATGRFFTALDIHRNTKVCIIGHEIKEKLFKEKEPIGQRIKVGMGKYRVIGVLEERGQMFGHNQDNVVLLPIGAFQRVKQGNRGILLAISVKNADHLEDMKQEARGILRKARKVAAGKEDDFALNQQEQLTELYNNLTATLFMIVFVIGGISLLVGGIGIMNIMLVSVTERTREIGIRKAIGARRRNILTQFIIESIAVSSVGGILGIIFGFIVGLVILSQMTLSTGVGVESIAIGFGFSTMVGILAGFYPAWKAARMNPIDSLHYE